MDVAALVVALISMALAYFFYRRSVREKRLVYGWAADSVVEGAGESPEGIQIVFRGSTVPRVTRTLISLWNRGRETVEGADIVAGSPIAFVIREEGNAVRVLNCNVVRMTRPEIAFEVSALADSDAQAVRFSFLDSQDGAMMEILHCGSTDSVVEFSGAIKGAPWGIKPFGRAGKINVCGSEGRWSGLALAATLMLPFLVVVLFMAPSWLRHPPLQLTGADYWAVIYSGCLFGLGLFGLCARMSQAARDAPRCLRPG